MFKLRDSLPEAKKLAAKEPDRFEVGFTNWVTARFTSAKPIPKKLWEKWLEESYDLCASPRKASMSKKKPARKMSARKKTTKKKTARKKASGKRPSKK